MAELRLSNGRSWLFWSTAQGLADRTATDANSQPDAPEIEGPGVAPSNAETQPAID
ncbi:MAG: hypothetical protein J7521_17190 [Caulobacter sp.]|nr:hypothetical protein [Caulobacter sp.]